MIRALIICFSIVMLSQTAHAQTFNAGADSVAFFLPGSGQNVGQGEDYFPANVLGLPDPNASATTPSAIPEQICSLGMGGEIILAFTDKIIVDGDGPDFTVFENVMLFNAGLPNEIRFVEPAKVAVSEDGLSFVEFPFDSLTLGGLAGFSPTNGAADPTNPAESGGDSFDLGEVGLDQARFIKLTDISQFLLDRPNHPYWSALISGFDLDAVVAVNYELSSMSVGNDPALNQFDILSPIFPNPVNVRSTSYVHCVLNQNIVEPVDIVITNIAGQRLDAFQLEPNVDPQYRLSIPISAWSSGHYFLSIKLKDQILTRRFTVVK